jgi:hypothetical protein
MPRSARIARSWASAACAATIVVGSLAAGPTAGAEATVPSAGVAATTGPQTSVTILLKAPNGAGLTRLAATHGLTHSQRVSALASLLPGRAVHERAVAALQQAGYVVVHQTAWTITAQAPSATIARDFGTPSTARGMTPAARIASAATLPSMPADLASLASTALPTAGADLLHPLLGPSQVHNGADFRNAYATPNVAPTTGEDAAGALTIATLQFTGWNPSDLTAYAAAHGVADPVASGQYVQIPVNQASVPTAKQVTDGSDEEVDLDQEVLLSTAPTANQRAYFSPNSSAGSYVEDLSQVLADVTQSIGAYQGGDPRIAALSTSWGFCERDFREVFNNESIANVEDVLKSLSAAGVTIFAASGDFGVYDCGDSPSSTRIAVDYPASSPEVVAVGGTNLAATGQKAANSGKNWSETAWTCTTARTCQGSAPQDTGGSGGGESRVFALPNYQSVGIGAQRFRTSSHHLGSFGRQKQRLLPDIAADGDPRSGFAVLTTDPVDDPSCAGGGTKTANRAVDQTATCVPVSVITGGTSLAAPESAALFTNMLGAQGAEAGVGDIHNALYSAYAAHNGSFRDVTTGSNGSQADVDRQAAKHQAAELPVSAQRHYDTVTGLGAPLWARIAPFIFTPTPATATATLRVATAHRPATGLTVTATWAGVRGAPGGSAPSRATVMLSRAGSTTPVFHSTGLLSSGSRTFPAIPGASYTLTVTERDLAGQSSTPTTTSAVAPYDDTTFRFTPAQAWSRVAAASDIDGSHASATAAGATATATASGRQYSLAVHTGPSSGYLGVYEGSTQIASYDLYSAIPLRRRLSFFGTSTSVTRTRTFRFRDSGERNPSSTGSEVDLDALYVVP